ncbi:DUF2474 family protein [Agrobacterium sp. rho-8.1]|nr:DUF2474 family protein [Agrobacterium sp. rho-8.1]
MLSLRVKRMVWFVGIWLASVALLSVLAYAIRLMVLG